MIALVRDPAGKPAGIHRTYIKASGHGKADIEPTKATLGLVRSGAIRLSQPSREMAVGEGLETSAAAGRLLGLPAWCAAFAGNMARSLVLPPEVRSVVIVVDRDPPGERAASRAGRRWRAEGRRTRFFMPDDKGADAADVLAARVAHG
jgi:putative DNA primase/helicase